MLWIESPVGVGFSYSTRAEDLHTGDERTAADSYSFVLRFFERFPQYANNDFVISGESYAGHYIPQLAARIMKGNQRVRANAGAPGAGASSVSGQRVIPLRGFLVGNPSTFHEVDLCGAVDYWWSHALISDAGLQGVHRHCTFCDPHTALLPPGAPGSDQPHGGVADMHDPDKYKKCNEYVDRLQDETGAINPYDIYADVCQEIKRGGAQRMMARLLPGSPAGAMARAAVKALDRALTQRLADRRDSISRQRVELAAEQEASLLQDQRDETHASLRRAGGDGSHAVPPTYDPCVDDEVVWYLNRPEVQQALHANQTAEARAHLPGRWSDCSDRVQYTMADMVQSMIPLYRELLQTNLSILVFSGDVDGVVPVVGTRRWVSSLQLKVLEDWRPWNDTRQQVGGYVIKYQGLTLATVRNAGHMVPYTQPERMYHLVNMFLAKAIEKAA